MAAKLGIVGLSRGIALDMVRFNVRSNSVSPFGWTRMVQSIPAETEEEKVRIARASQMTPEKVRAAGRLSRLRCGGWDHRSDLVGAQQ